jgi:hypothetical protein
MAPLRAPEPDKPNSPERWPLAVRLGVAGGPELVASGLGSVGLAVDMGARWHAVSLAVEVHGDPPGASVTYPGVGSVAFARVSSALLACAHYGWFVGRPGRRGGQASVQSAGGTPASW